MSAASIKEWAASLRNLPRTVAIKVAANAAPALTEAARSTFVESSDAYGAPWAPGAKGQKVTLRKGGGLFAGVYYVATGTKIRLKLSVPYAKFQVGRRPVTPRQGEILPAGYSDALKKSTNATIRAELGQ